MTIRHLFLSAPYCTTFHTHTSIPFPRIPTATLPRAALFAGLHSSAQSMSRRFPPARRTVGVRDDAGTVWGGSRTHSARTRGAACSNIPNGLNRSIDFRTVMLEEDLLLLANYRPENFRRNALNGITCHTGSAVMAVWPRGRVRGN